MEKRFNYRIYPTKAQEEQIQRNFGCCRFVYNYFLNKRIERYKAGEGIYGFYEACKDLTALKKTEGYEWLKVADSHSLQHALKNMNFAYSEFYRRVREKSGSPGFPRFKKKRETHKSYTSQTQKTRCVIDVRDNKILLPKLGLVDCKVSRQIEGRILSASVIQVPSGKYFVSVCCTDIVPEQLPQTGNSIGLHFGIKTLAVTSDGQKIENQRYLEKMQKKISRLQRRVSRKPSDSANREKARIALAKAYEQIKNQKTDTLQKSTTQLVRDNDLIVVRDEELTKIVRRKQFAYYLSDASWGEFTQMLKYKSAWYGRTFVEISANYPSAQLCSSCGYKNIELVKKQLQEWTCPKCGTHHERAKNAAVNTMAEGLRVLSEIAEEMPKVA
jgi:putative transposase